MLLTITTTHQPATDLGHLLRKAGMKKPERIDEIRVGLWLDLTQQLCSKVISQLLKSNVPTGWTVSNFKPAV